MFTGEIQCLIFLFSMCIYNQATVAGRCTIHQPVKNTARFLHCRPRLIRDKVLLRPWIHQLPAYWLHVIGQFRTLGFELELACNGG